MGNYGADLCESFQNSLRKLKAVSVVQGLQKVQASVSPGFSLSNLTANAS